MLVGKAGYDYFFFPNAKYFDEKTFGLINDSGYTSREGSGSTFFAFRFSPSSTTEGDKFHYKKGFEPYKHGLEELTKEAMTESSNYSCSAGHVNGNYCTALIQLNGWKIPDDYPYKVK